MARRLKASEKPHAPLQINFVRADGRYRVGKLLSFGGSGSVYLGKDILKGAEVALKIGGAGQSRLEHEYNVYKSIAGNRYASPLLWYGREDGHEVIALEYLGNSLDDLINEKRVDCGKVFSYASKMLSAIASLHNQHYVHRNIKPSNFMVRARADGVAPSIFLINFGLARQFREPATYKHTVYTTKHSIVGTLEFMSVNGQQGHTQSRRDDLESLAYTIIFSARGHLPWIAASIRRDHKAVLQKKMSITAEELCEGLPPLFSEFIIHVRSLDFDKKPDYEHLHAILKQCSETETD